MKLIERIQQKLAEVTAQDAAVEAQKQALSELLAGLKPENEDLLLSIVKEHTAAVVETAVERSTIDEETKEQVVDNVIPELAGHAEVLDQTQGESMPPPEPVAETPTQPDVTTTGADPA